MRVLLEFKNSHHYWEEYETSDFYCPKCGAKEVWVESGSGDYYEGPAHFCSNCEFSFTMPSGSTRNGAWGEIPKQLKSGIANTPTTREGK